jgi:ElaB/YqjD/DUF883 family membrane-anchored ribosome-binding protein
LDQHMTGLYGQQAEYLKGLLLLGAAAGGGLAGMRGIVRHMGRRRLKPLPHSADLAHTVVMPSLGDIPAELEEEEGQEKKAAAGEVLRAVDRTIAALPPWAQLAGGGPHGYGATHPSAITHLRSHWPLTAGALALGGYTTYSVLDKLIRRADKARVRKLEEDTQADFERALKEQYDALRQTKKSAESATPVLLAKQADGTVGPSWNTAVGLYAASGLGLGALTHMLALSRLRKADRTRMEYEYLRDRFKTLQTRRAPTLRFDVSTPGVFGQETALERALGLEEEEDEKGGTRKKKAGLHGELVQSGKQKVMGTMKSMSADAETGSELAEPVVQSREFRKGLQDSLGAGVREQLSKLPFGLDSLVVRPQQQGAV